ncbi:MAG: hypothetical protein OES69_04360 [Myxococcales bacterium]|nr:hypothetical protein [Myxococcales bacterium]
MPKTLELRPAPKAKILAGGSLKESDYLVRRYTAMIPISHTLADVESPGYFQFYADQLAKSRGHGPVKLEILSYDCSVHAEYMVLEATRGGVKLRKMVVYHDASAVPELTEESVLEQGSKDTDPFSKNWSTKHKWRILEHGEVVAINVQSKEAADELLERLNAGTLSTSEIPSAYSAPSEP